MHDRVEELIRTLGLVPHPEGGHFVETFRSTLRVAPADGRPARAALTAIFFLLPAGACSRWHRVRSDEAWHWYEGAPLELLTVPAEGGAITVTTLGPLADASAPQHVVPAGWWQAARPVGGYALVGCTVGPGFDFADFALLGDVPAAELPAMYPASLVAELR